MIRLQELVLFIREWQKDHKHLRLGQAFVNEFIQGSWPKLFYEEDSKVAETTIYQWFYNKGEHLERN